SAFQAFRELTKSTGIATGAERRDAVHDGGSATNGTSRAMRRCDSLPGCRILENMSETEVTTRRREWLYERRTLFAIAAAIWMSFAIIQVGQTFVFARAAGRVWTLT